MAFDQGQFRPTRPEKYRGRVGEIFYRSGWERQVMSRLDLDPGVTWWSSEELVIPYVKPTDGRRHRYIPDFVVGRGDAVEVLEVKPRSQSVRPTSRGTTARARRRLVEATVVWAVNEAKWAAARAFCAARGWQFRVLTEDQRGHFVPVV